MICWCRITAEVRSPTSTSDNCQPEALLFAVTRFYQLLPQAQQQAFADLVTNQIQ
jgi:hypothetical protein